MSSPKLEYNRPLVTRLEFSADTKVSLLVSCKNANAVTSNSAGSACVDGTGGPCQNVGS